MFIQLTSKFKICSEKNYEKLSEEHEVWIVAPKSNCSGMSAAISYLNEIEVKKIDEKIFSVDGTPADCSYLGLLSIVDFEFDMVVSGINHGANIGNDVLYSGTVGAAVGGRNLKYPPIAISVASYDAKDINFIAKKSCEIVDKIFSANGLLKGRVININFPDINQNEFKGVLATGLSKRDVPAKPIRVDDSSSNIYRYKYNISGEPLEDKYMTDAEAVKNGYVSLTVLDYSLNSGNFIDEITQVLNE